MTWVMCTYGQHKHPTHVAAEACDNATIRARAEAEAKARAAEIKAKNQAEKKGKRR